MTRHQIHRHILALMIVWTVAAPVCADAGLPAPSLDLTFLFENLEKYPNYDFYLKYERRGFRKVDQVRPGQPLHLGGRQDGGLGEIFLVAVPSGQNMEAPKELRVEPMERKADWLKNAPVGGLQSQALKANAAGAPPRAYNGYDITYRVRIEGDRLEVEWIDSNLNAWWSTARLIAILIAAACVLVPVAIVALVIYLIVRSNRRTAAANSADTDTR